MEVTEKISDILQKFDLVQVIIEEGTTENLMENFMNSEALKKAQKKILILSSAEPPHTDLRNHEYRRLNQEELDAIRKLYMMYEFSDRFRVLSDDPQYGGLLNYVKTGVMTMEEVFQAVLA